MILMDAGPMVALLDARDQHYARCTEAFAAIRQPIVTVWPAVTEALFLLGFSLPAQLALLGKIAEGTPRLLRLDEADVPRIEELMRKYADQPMDLADAALVRVAERDRLATIFTIDRRDFETYRPLGFRRFRIVP